MLQKLATDVSFLLQSVLHFVLLPVDLPELSVLCVLVVCFNCRFLFLVDCFVADSIVQVWQAKYDLEEQMSLAKFLVDADIRLVRAECPPVCAYSS